MKGFRMMYSYLELKKLKDDGQKLDFNSISKEQLEKLFYEENIPDSLIGELYNVSKNVVRNKRYKWDIKFFNGEYLSRKYNNNGDFYNNLNEKCKNLLINEDNIEWLSKSLTHYLFRDGPIEDMHANHQLSQEDMKTLNKYMVNRTAGLLKTLFDGEWAKVFMLFNSMYYKNCGSNWDKPEYDTYEMELVFKDYLDNLNK